jgi:hypothetical protein
MSKDRGTCQRAWVSTMLLGALVLGARNAALADSPAPSVTALRGSTESVNVLAGARGLASTVSATWDFTAGSNDLISKVTTSSRKDRSCES